MSFNSLIWSKSPKTQYKRKHQYKRSDRHQLNIVKKVYKQRISISEVEIIIYLFAYPSQSPKCQSSISPGDHSSPYLKHRKQTWQGRKTQSVRKYSKFTLKSKKKIKILCKNNTKKETKTEDKFQRYFDDDPFGVPDEIPWCIHATVLYPCQLQSYLTLWVVEQYSRLHKPFSNSVGFSLFRVDIMISNLYMISIHNFTYTIHSFSFIWHIQIKPIPVERNVRNKD